MKQRFDALTVILNGPRHFLMDSITAGGATEAGKTIEAGGLQLTERAAIDVGLLNLMHRPYRELTIDRDTATGSRPGTPCSCSRDRTAAATPCRPTRRSSTSPSTTPGSRLSAAG